VNRDASQRRRGAGRQRHPARVILSDRSGSRGEGFGGQGRRWLAARSVLGTAVAKDELIHPDCGPAPGGFEVSCRVRASPSTEMTRIASTRSGRLRGRPAHRGGHWWPLGRVRLGPPSANEAAMPAQDRVGGDEAVARQCAGQPPHEGGNTARSARSKRGRWVAAVQDGDLVREHQELDVLGGGRATRQQHQPEYVPEHQVQQPQRHARSCPINNHRWSTAQNRLPAPHRLRPTPTADPAELTADHLFCARAEDQTLPGLGPLASLGHGAADSAVAHADCDSCRRAALGCAGGRADRAFVRKVRRAAANALRSSKMS